MWNRRIFVVSFFLVLNLFLSAIAQATNDSVKAPSTDGTVASAAAKDDRYRIGFQDVLDIQVFKHPELSQRAPVSPNGTIVLFRLERPVVAVCKTERELATDIANAYKEKYLRDPQVNVVVAEQK